LPFLAGLLYTLAMIECVTKTFDFKVYILFHKDSMELPKYCFQLFKKSTMETGKRVCKVTNFKVE